MDIVVLDLASTRRVASKGSVAFQTADSDSDESDDQAGTAGTETAITDNVARHYLTKYAAEFNLPIPDSIVAPDKGRTALNKLFQYTNGSIVPCSKDYHDFEYLSFLEKFELNQYQSLLDQSMAKLFQMTQGDYDSERKTLMYYDHTTMEAHICSSLLFSTSREIMRTTVRLVCGAPTENVSVLFYLHQCYRTNSAKNHLDGDNTRFREKLLGYCRKHLVHKLQKSIADIIQTSKTIKEIRTLSDEEVILETILGEDDYVCNLLAMALRPDQLNNIEVDSELFTEQEALIAKAMMPGYAKKFLIQYEDQFWRRDGYSGDILSIRGPIIWAMERPRMSTAGGEKCAALVGYLKVVDSETSMSEDSKQAVIEQLVKLFGERASNPISYRETSITDVFIPRCGDYIALRRLTDESPKGLEWGSMDIFGEGDVIGAIEAGHRTYLRMLSILRPQSQTFEDVTSLAWPTMLDDNLFSRLLARLNFISGIKLLVLCAAASIGWRLLRSYTRK